MTLSDLKTRVQETTGLEVITLDSLNTAIRNAFADMTSRGYREFEEASFLADDFTALIDGRKYTLEMPDDVRKVLRVKARYDGGIHTIARVALANTAIDDLVDEGSNEYQFNFTNSISRAIFYIKKDDMILEFDRHVSGLSRIDIQYYKKLTAPEWAKDVQALDDVTITIRKELEEALVFYCCYFFYARYFRDPDKIQGALSTYKYFMEDVLHELKAEDLFNEAEAVIYTGED